MKRLALMVALAFGFALAGFGGAGDAQAKPKGWHNGHHYGYGHGSHRHYGWNRGRHLGWYKHRHHHRAYWRYERW